ncbi:MerC domain-containing protein [Alginatibacterium sediminis]|uniref:MerC domain-containing protein n=1 Tax=Alginatibacterium sediminis TaxID=2164068 RepID=A0A420E9X8_9ALTE|nr:MerC domain-containing protein [Alginatibacterium sediminis]RKF17475.1 MerC domain-containing protein [Alginatibacterium sediminis]
MTYTSALPDKAAIGLSILCVVHCLALPVFIVVVPNSLALYLDNESFHLWMLVAVIPISAYALTLGCKKHKRNSLLLLGGTGVLFMIAAVTIGEHYFGELGEKGLTLLGGVLVAFGHYQNYRACKCSHKE